MTDEVTMQAPIEQAPIAAQTTSETAPIAEVTPVEVTPVEVIPTESTSTLLGADKSVEPIAEVKTAESEIKTEPEVKGEEGIKETEGSQSDEPAPLPTYDEFKIPEGITLDSEQVGDFTKKLAEFEVKTKADHAEVQALGQSLIERHVADVQNNIDKFSKTLIDSFEKQKSDWKESFEKDPEIGGNRKDTTINAALEFIKTHGGNEEQRKELHQLMDETGVGNHPAILRLFAKAMTNMAEGKPLPATRPVMQKSKLDKFYGNTM